MYCKKTRNDCKQCVISSAGVCPGSNTTVGQKCLAMTSQCASSLMKEPNDRTKERKQWSKRQIEGRLNWKRIINKDAWSNSLQSTIYSLHSPQTGVESCESGWQLPSNWINASVSTGGSVLFYLATWINSEISHTHTHTKTLTHILRDMLRTCFYFDNCYARRKLKLNLKNNFWYELLIVYFRTHWIGLPEREISYKHTHTHTSRHTHTHIEEQLKNITKMPVFHTKTIESILDPVAQQVREQLMGTV